MMLLGTIAASSVFYTLWLMERWQFTFANDSVWSWRVLIMLRRFNPGYIVYTVRCCSWYSAKITQIGSSGLWEHKVSISRTECHAVCQSLTGFVCLLFWCTVVLCLYMISNWLGRMTLKWPIFMSKIAVNLFEWIKIWQCYMKTCLSVDQGIDMQFDLSSCCLWELWNIFPWFAFAA